MRTLMVFFILSVFNSVLCWNSKIKFRTRWPRYKPSKEYGPPQKPINLCLGSICPRGEEHITCLTHFWSPNCKRPRIGVDMKTFKQPIVDLHNLYRKEFADNVGKIWPGRRSIPPVTWSNNLSLLAMRISNLCSQNISHYCVNLPEYRNVAESTDYLIHRGTPHTRNHFNLFLKQWFQYKDKEDHFNISSFPSKPTKEEILFANMVFDKVTKIGCGLLTSAGIWFFSCLYNHKILPGQHLYRVYPTIKSEITHLNGNSNSSDIATNLNPIKIVT